MNFDFEMSGTGHIEKENGVNVPQINRVLPTEKYLERNLELTKNMARPTPEC